MKQAPYGLPKHPTPDRRGMRLGSGERLSEIAQRPRYALAITIGLCLAPFLYHCGWYVGAEPCVQTQAAR